MITRTLPLGAFILASLILLEPGHAQDWVDGRELGFHVSVSVRDDDNKRRRTSLSIYEKVLYVDREGLLRTDHFRASQGTLASDNRLPYPTRIGRQKLRFNFPSVYQEAPTDPIRLQFYESLVFILGRDVKTRATTELNIGEFVIEDKETKEKIDRILNTGRIVDDEGRTRRVLGIGIDLAFNKLDIPKIEADLDSLKVRAEDVRLEVEKLPDRSLGENVLKLDEFRAMREPLDKTRTAEMIGLNQLHARCEVIYQ